MRKLFLLLLSLFVFCATLQATDIKEITSGESKGLEFTY